MNQEEENQHIDQVRQENDPQKLPQQVRRVLEITVGLETGVSGRVERAALTNRLLQQAYDETKAMNIDSHVYDNPANFFDEMIRSTIVGAQIYAHNRNADRRFGGGNSGEKQEKGR